MSQIVATGGDPQVAEQYAQRAQRTAEDHLAAVWAHFYADADGTPTGEDPAIGAFCGCQTCEVREVLTVAVPVLVEGLANGDLEVVGDE